MKLSITENSALVPLCEDSHNGTAHVKWDNGRGLGLVFGEDSFTVLPPETHLLKLYMPMTVDYYERNEWGDMDSEPTEMSDREVVEYADNITAALLRERHPEEAERGMMTYTIKTTASIRRSDRTTSPPRCVTEGSGALPNVRSSAS